MCNNDRSSVTLQQKKGGGAGGGGWAKGKVGVCSTCVECLDWEFELNTTRVRLNGFYAHLLYFTAPSVKKKTELMEEYFFAFRVGRRNRRPVDGRPLLWHTAKPGRSQGDMRGTYLCSIRAPTILKYTYHFLVHCNIVIA